MSSKLLQLFNKQTCHLLDYEFEELDHQRMRQVGASVITLSC
ncbi:hypothetical protein V6Z12_D10G267600 [Gossypium hirsutum]